MKKWMLYSLMALFFIGCADEDELEPTPMKNWFAIEEKENMDVVDQKIYDLYQKFGIGIFYNDTLGFEDRGRRDSVGNVMYHYEVLDLNYNFTTTASTNKVTWKLVDVTTKENKERLLPVLNFLESTLLPFLVSVEVNLPAIVITETFKVSNKAKTVYRGFNFLGIALGTFADDADTKTTYQAAFIAQTCAKKIENMLQPFREVSELALADLTTSTWGKYWKGGTNALFESYSTAQKNVQKLNAYEETMATLLATKAELDARIAVGEITEEDSEYISCINSITSLEDLKAQEQLWRDEWKRCQPMNYGMLELGGSNNNYSPTKEEDLAAYLIAEFSYTLEEFSAAYAEWPYCILRFQILENILKEAGFDMNALRGTK